MQPTADPPSLKKTGKKEHAELLRKALDRFQNAVEAESDIREDALDDLRFRAGEQWPAGIRKSRNEDQRPCLTVNRLPQIIQQVTNEQRQQRPSIQVNPVGDGADADTAKVIEGLNRHIDTNSNSEVAIDTAFDSMVTGGFGYFRYVTDYATPNSFDQEILCKRVLNPFTVYFDPAATEPDYSDAMYAFVIEDLSHDTYKEKYPDSELAGLTNFTSIGDQPADWTNEASIRIAEYWMVESETKTLCKLADGSTAYLDELPAEGVHIVARRETTKRTVRWLLINASEVLEERDWPGQWIPIIPVLGTELIVAGRRHLIGVVRNAKDPQRMYNYWVSAQTEMIALAPKAPFMVAEGQIEGYEALYEAANTRNLAVLTYKPKSLGGNYLPPPARQVAEPPIQAISVAIAQSSEDLKSTTGLYDASLGANGPEKSGKAILARQKEGDTANLHYSDNLTRSIKHAGRIVIDLIPHIYDAARVIRIMQPDQTMKQVAINQPTLEAGVQKLYDLTSGRYDVTVSVGPTYASKRQEAVDSMLQLVESYPALMQFVGDLLVKNMDWPEAEEVAERLKKMLPPQLQEADPNGPAPIPPQVQQQMQMMGQQHDMLAQRVHQLMDVINTKKIECDSRERIAAMNAQVTLIATEATINSKNAQTLLGGELASIKHRLDMLNDNSQAAADRDQEAGMAQQSQQADAQQQQDAQAHQADQATQSQQAAAQQATQSQQATAAQQQAAAEQAAKQPAAKK